MKLCDIEGCAKQARSKSSALCKMHYHRQYRNGSPGEAAERKRKQRSLHCHIADCQKPDTEGGLCSMHAARKRRNGDPLIVTAPEDRVFRTGEDHHNWMGSAVGYAGAHGRVGALRGSASMHECADCGQPAKHWSYNHDDPDELVAIGLSANPIAYSDKPSHYSPRCVSCHKTFDLGRLDAHAA